MSRERPAYLPELPEQPELYPRTDYVPTLRHSPPVDAGSQSDPRPEDQVIGQLIASFPLGVKDEADLNRTTWHTILAFRERAQQVKDTLKKGDPVEVIGYRHEREIPRRDGSTRTVHEVYATVLKPR